MEKREALLAEIQEVPRNSLILLIGPPGGGKSTFCHQVVLNSLAADRSVIFVTSERSPAEVVELLSKKGMREPVGLNFVDAFSETVGLTATQRSDTVYANCADLNSLSIAITKLQERAEPKGTLLVFDSLTSPYLLSGTEVVKFMGLFLSKFASEGNSVLVCIDEGCGKEEDIGAMMSVAGGILRMEIRESLRIINVVKHPKVTATRLEVLIERERIELKASAHGMELATEVETRISYGPKLIPQKFLSAGEHPLYETRPLLWPVLVGPVMLGVLGIVIYVVTKQFELGLEDDFNQMLAQTTLMVVGWIGIGVLVFGLLRILYRWARWRYTVYTVTDRRILRQTGIIGKSYIDCSLDRVQNVYLHMSILGRIFGFGTIRVATAGTAAIEIEWKGIKNPREAQRALNGAIEQYRARQAVLE